uniref:Uncharacterized protein n=1 Tax=Rhipicephalus pulchellus TaxID=72859 RepID=L7LVP8_RHIPC
MAMLLSLLFLVCVCVFISCSLCLFLALSFYIFLFFPFLSLSFSFTFLPCLSLSVVVLLPYIFSLSCLFLPLSVSFCTRFPIILSTLTLTSLCHPLAILYNTKLGYTILYITIVYYTILYYTKLCYALRACLDSRVVMTLAPSSWGRGFKSRLAQKKFLAGIALFLHLSSSLSVLLVSPIRGIASRAGEIGARVVGAKREMKKTATMKERTKRTRVDSRQC